MAEPNETSEPPSDGAHPAQVGVTQIALGAAPGLARIAAGAWYRSARWGVETTVRTTGKVVSAAATGASAADLASDLRDELVDGARKALGVTNLEQMLAPITGGRKVEPGQLDATVRDHESALRTRGNALLQRSTETSSLETNTIHPGYERIVDQLAPDEARVLNLLCTEGPQAIVYVNKAAPLGLGKREVARRLSLIGREAGCLHPELVPAYLDNLVRLGLVAIRQDPVKGEMPYQVLEAQPEVVEAVKSAKGGIFVGMTARRSVHLSDFGSRFCSICFGLGDGEPIT